VNQVSPENRSLAGKYIARSAPLLIAIAGIGALLAYLLWPADAAQSPRPQAEAAGWQQEGVANPFGKGAQAAAQSDKTLTVGSSAPISLAHTSLAGTQPDGDWGIDAQGQLKASRALRQRFDYYLSLIGEMPLADIHALVLQAAKQSLKEPALGQVIALWERYVQLQQHAWKHAVDLRQSASWSAALSERQIVRRQMLGADVAQAFYADEERELQDMLARLNAGQGSAVSSTEPAQSVLHPQASQREAELQVQWQQWDQRIAVARQQIQAIAQAPELSELQRQQNIQQVLASQFQGTELTRARALLGL
jgi:lipase chaperone LimK